MDKNKNVSVNILAFFLIMSGVAVGLIGLSKDVQTDTKPVIETISQYQIDQEEINL